jgi:hypothetical protein
MGHWPGRTSVTGHSRSRLLTELAHSVLSRHLYIEPLSLGLLKRMPVPEVASHLVCSVCGAKNSDTYHPIWARPDARVPGVTGKYPRW